MSATADLKLYTDVVYESRKELWIFDERQDGCPELPPRLRFPTIEEIELWEHGELERPFVVFNKTVRCPNDEKPVHKVTAKDRDDLRLYLVAIERLLELLGCLSTTIVVTLPDRVEVIYEGKYGSFKMLKPMTFTAARKLKIQNEVVSEGGRAKWERVPD
jgi:hypothetical protein